MIITLTRTSSSRYNTKNSFGVIINKFQDCNIKNIRALERKSKNSQTTNPYIYIYIYIYIHTTCLMMKKWGNQKLWDQWFNVSLFRYVFVFILYCTHTHTHTHTNIYMRVRVRVNVCVPKDFSCCWSWHY